MHAVQRTTTEIAVNGTAFVDRARSVPTTDDSAANFLPFAHQNSEALSKIFTESYDASFVSSHGNDLSALRVGMGDKLHYLIRDLGRSVFSSFRSCRCLVQKRCPEPGAVTMNNRSSGRVRLVNRGVRQRFR